MSYAARSGKSASQLGAEFGKRPGEKHDYLEKDRAYRSEDDVFEHFTEEQRDAMFGVPPATVWETLESLGKWPAKTAVLSCGDVFSESIIAAYRKACLTRWTMELYNRIIPANADFVRSCVRLHDDDNLLDEQRWAKIQGLRQRLMRDETERKAVFTQVREAIDRRDYAETSRLQLEMSQLIQELRSLYQSYRRNILPDRAPRQIG